MDKNDWPYVFSSDARRKVLFALEKGDLTPSVISKITGLRSTHTSRALKELEKYGFIECLTPESRKGKLYRLTSKGMNAFKTIKPLWDTIYRIVSENKVK